MWPSLMTARDCRDKFWQSFPLNVVVPKPLMICVVFFTGTGRIGNLDRPCSDEKLS